jgi:phenylalanyl-tRNA synthetase beta chain
MLFLRSWLEDYIDLSKYSNEELVEWITSKSSEVDEFYEVNEYFNGKVVIGKIIEIQNHPQSDKLNILTLQINQQSKVVNIVCGAGNVSLNMFVPVALDGASLPFFPIANRKIRGVESFGMCCGKSELGAETETSSGLWNLAEDLSEQELENRLGDSVCQVFSTYFPQDFVFDIKVLPDKIGVLGSHLGMAFELSLIIENGEKLLTQTARAFLDPENIDKEFAIINAKIETREELEIDDKIDYIQSFDLYKINLEKDYILPHEYQLRMKALDKVLKGGFADLTNYIMYDIGQPSHVFGSKIFN